MSVDISVASTSQWRYQLREVERETPSRREGLSFKDEMKMKFDMCSHLQRLGVRLQVPQSTIATAMTYLHRFAMRCSLQDFDLKMLPVAFMYLSCKVEETGRRAKDLLSCDFAAKHRADDNPSTIENEKMSDEEIEKQRESLFAYERIILQVLCFELLVEHPYSYLLKYMHSLFQEKRRELAQVSWNFVNDSYMRSNLCLTHPPAHIALACIELAAKYTTEVVSTTNSEWYTEAPYALPEPLMQSIISHLQAMYEGDTRSIEQIAQHHLEKARERQRAKKEADLQMSKKMPAPASELDTMPMAKKQKVAPSQPLDVEDGEILDMDLTR